MRTCIKRKLGNCFPCFKRSPGKKSKPSSLDGYDKTSDVVTFSSHEKHKKISYIFDLMRKRVESTPCNLEQYPEIIDENLYPRCDHHKRDLYLVLNSVRWQMTKLNCMVKVLVEKQFDVVPSDFSIMSHWLTLLKAYFDDVGAVVTPFVESAVDEESRQQKTSKSVHDSFDGYLQLRKYIADLVRLVKNIDHKLEEKGELTLNIANGIDCIVSNSRYVVSHMIQWTKDVATVYDSMVRRGHFEPQRAVHRQFLKQLHQGIHKREKFPMFMETVTLKTTRRNIWIYALRADGFRYRRWVLKYRKQQYDVIPRYNIPTYV